MMDPLIDASLRDRQAIAACMRADNYVSEGTNNIVWRLSGLGDRSYIVRVNRHSDASGQSYQETFRNAEATVLTEVPPAASLNAFVAQPVAAFYIYDDAGKKTQLAEIQPEMKGRLLGLTNDEKASRETKTIRVLTQDETEDNGWGLITREAGSCVTKTTENLAGIAKTNASMMDLQKRLLDQPPAFIAQAMKDVLEIEEAGYKIDPSKGQNFFFLEKEGRLGFLDLTESDRGRRMPPSELAVILCSPLAQMWHKSQSAEEIAAHEKMGREMCAKVIAVCDKLGIAYAPEDDAGACRREAELRKEFGLQKPEGIKPIQFDQKGTVVGSGLGSQDIDVGVFTQAAQGALPPSSGGVKNRRAAFARA